ncbi:putative transcriptional regulator [Desulfofarcimen acetoxidans DSM 771]|uniref:Putative transcriptional regulator n=1 Tax=Desulfofarcimen acetoxidans (strain ATCC 49208 / DSM 771 / KCTC 5769 / VKM B-1644 / 5575) TaxID=485916 RepID=C8VVL1_DESAS|nr:ATP-binding protein [Desulfofarcimen acetoxidans]ACV62326.1 putative transcriptional regulator [Desulfofarcimen acetoxidans DSM 771]
MLTEELMELIEELKLGKVETQKVECKEARVDIPRSLVESLSAFSNATGGGIVLLGVGDAPTFPILGVNNIDRLQSAVTNMCAQELEPPIRPQFSLHNISGRILLVIEVPEAGTPEKPVYIKARGIYHGSFMRQADGDHQLTEYEVLKLIENRGQPRHDMEFIDETSEADLEQESIDAFIARVRERAQGPIGDADKNTILRSTRVLAERDGRLTPTVAGLLMFGKMPQFIFPNLRVVFLVYPNSDPNQPGPNGERYLVNEPVEGNITTILQRLILLLGRHLQKRTVITGSIERDELWEYPREALREALANALLHRDYSPQARGSQIQVSLFPDRLTISNPGGLFGTVTLDNIDQPDVQQARNSALMRIAEDSGIVENRGGGVGAIIAAMRKYNLSPPLFKNTLSRFNLTFKNHHLLGSEALKWLDSININKLNSNQRLALVYAHKEGRIANRDYQRLCGVDTVIATRELGDMVQVGALNMSGTRRWAYYELSPQLSGLEEDIKFKGLPADSKKIWKYVRDNQPVARKEIIKALKGIFTENQIDYRLEKLVENNLIVATNLKEKASNRKYIIK